MTGCDVGSENPVCIAVIAAALSEYGRAKVVDTEAQWVPLHPLRYGDRTPRYTLLGAVSGDRLGGFHVKRKNSILKTYGV